MHNLIYGFHSIISLIKTNPHNIEVIYLDIKRQDKRQQELIALAQANNITFKSVNASELAAICSSNSHQGVVAKISANALADFRETLTSLDTKTRATILVLDGITDPQNLGAIIRTADCFGVDAIILPKNNSASIDNPVVAKASSGAINNLAVIVVNNISQALETLKQHDFWIAGTALAPNALNLFEFNCSSKMAWVMGNEGAGMRRLVAEHCDYLITIPMQGKTGSLNVSVATGVVLSYANFRQNKE